METVHSLRIDRIDHGSVQNANMSYSQRQPPTHRPNHAPTEGLYKPSRSPLTGATTTGGRYPPYSSASPQQVATVPPNQRYVQLATATATGGGAAAPPTGAAGAPPPNFTFRDIRPQRISLLPAGQEYLAAAGRASREYGIPPPSHQPPPSASGALHLIEQGQQPGPFKKIRLQDAKDSIQPLRIDTREQHGAYNPQVEAISPTPDHVQQEESAFKTTKDDLLQQIGKVDREIAKAESQIAILKKKEKELEDVASRPTASTVKVEVDAQPKHQSLAQKIYAENRKKAQNAHATLDAFGPQVDWPIYNQPSDSPTYQENKRRYVAFKKRLLEYFKRRHAEKDARNTYLTDTYSKLMQEWLRKVDKIESSTKRKAKEAKNREFFEKVFPELRKQREDKERFNRVGARIKSEADMEEIMDNLQEQALEDKKMRSYAVIPPILFDAKERRLTYQNRNGHIEDMEAVYKSRQFLNVWTSSEKELFKEKYLQHPKNFGVIASYLDRKSVSDCVQYYYLSKKTENYKQLLRKTRQRTRSSRNNPQKVNSAASASAADILTTGVTTRLQREQQQKTGITRGGQSTSSANVNVSGNNSNNESNSNENSNTKLEERGQDENVMDAATTNNNSNEQGSNEKLQENSNESANGNNLFPSTASLENSNSNIGNANSTEISSNSKSDTKENPISILNSNQNIVPAVNTSVSNGTMEVVDDNNTSNNSTANNNNPEGGASSYVKVEPMDTTTLNTTASSISTMENITSDHQLSNSTGNNNNAGGSNPGNISSATSTPGENKKKKERRKDKENQAMETTDEECVADVQDKSVQGQCIVCGLQLGPQLQSRPLLPSQASQYGLREDQVPSNGRVCNTCRCKCVRSRYTHCPLPTCPNSRGRVKRLRSLPQRLLELPQEVREPILQEFHVAPGITKCCSACFNRIQRRLGPIEEWPEEEINLLRTCLTELGASWQSIGERMNKPAHAVRSFYAANRKRHNLESCLGDRKPTLTDEEESGSSTSSCEMGPSSSRDRHSSDTASAESPPVSNPQDQGGHATVNVKKEDYDSSATETADEGQTPDHYQTTATISGEGLTTPMTVKDLMSNVIELSLKKTPSNQQSNQHPPTSGTAPTISSILKDSNEVTIVGEYTHMGAHPGRSNQQQSRNEQVNIAKVQPLIAATITPVPGPVQMELPQGQDLVVMQVNESPENLTLDLSVKKSSRELPPPAHSKPPYIYHPQEHQKVYVPPKLPSPKLANPKAGSITRGTPIVSQPRYEGLLRQMPPEPKMGSITQGTPIHVPHITDKRYYDYIKGRPSGPIPVPQPPPPQQQQQVHPVYAAAYRTQQSFDQMTSRQIIMNDYITSQQMIPRRGNEKQFYTRTPPPPQQQQQQQPPQPQQQRQGVIQRHTRPHYHPPPPTGHEALNSLVDVAVQQPSLPVPSAHEGLGKTMADNILEQPRRYQMLQHQQHMRQQQQQHQQQQQQQRMEVERRIQQQQQQQLHHHRQSTQPPRSDTSTQMTAASLIDAIITHQINQSEDNRQHQVTNNREPQSRVGDRLFQVIPRDAQRDAGRNSCTDNNGDMSPHVINVDLDSSDSGSKNPTMKDLTDSVINRDFGAPSHSNFYQHMQQQHHREQQQQIHREHENEWKRRMAKEDAKRSVTPQQPPPQQQDERQIIRMAQQQQKYLLEPVSPTENHWSEQNFRHRYPVHQPSSQSHMSPLDYVKNRIVEVMRTEDDKKEHGQAPPQDDGSSGQQQQQQNKDRDSPGEMVIDEEKHEEYQGGYQQQSHHHGPSNVPPNEPKPLLSAQYESLSDED